MAKSTLPRLLAVAGLATLALAVARCSPPVFAPTVHTLGQYKLCLRRLSDACVAGGPDGGCQTLATNTLTVSLGDDPDGGFLWSRAGLAPIGGRRVGSRFELSTSEAKVATICGCEADVTETIRGELAAERADPLDCAGTADLDAGCGDVPAPAEFFDGGLPGAGWLEGGEVDGGATSATYGSFRAVVVDDARAADARQSCPCLPCRVVYEALGTE